MGAFAWSFHMMPCEHDYQTTILWISDKYNQQVHEFKLSRAYGWCQPVIELVKLQYSGAEHGLVRGIGLVNLVHSAGAEKDFYPMYYRIYAPEQDGKSKNGHFAEMVITKDDLLSDFLQAELASPRVQVFMLA